MEADCTLLASRQLTGTWDSMKLYGPQRLQSSKVPVSYSRNRICHLYSEKRSTVWNLKIHNFRVGCQKITYSRPRAQFCLHRREGSLLTRCSCSTEPLRLSRCPFGERPFHKPLQRSPESISSWFVLWKY